MKAASRPLVLCVALSALCFAGQAAADSSPSTQLHASPSPAVAKVLKKIQHAQYFGGVSVSPDGSRLAWTTHTKNGSRVQLADIDGSNVQTVSLANAFKGCSEGRASWSPDGSQLAFLSNCGNPKNKAQKDIYLVDADSTTAKRLTHLDGYVHNLSWAPHGKQLGILYVVGDTHPIAATAASKPRVGVIGVSGVEHQQMARVNADNGSVHTVTPKSLFVYEYTFSPNAHRVAYVAAPPPGANNWWKAKLYTQTVDNGQPQERVDAWRASGSLHHLQMALPRFSPDGNTIAFIGGLMSDQGATGGDIYTVPAAGGTVTNITPKIRKSPSWFTWTDNQHLLVSSIDGAQSTLGLFTLDGTQPAKHKALFSSPSSFSDGTAASALAFSADHSHFAYTHSTFSEAPEIYAGRLALNAAGQPAGVAASAHAVTHVNADLEPQWGKAVQVNWRNEGHDVAGWLLLPADYDPEKSYPMVVNVHGGPVWAVRSRWPGRGFAAPLSMLGYFVFMPNPRGSLGQGAAYTEAVRKDMGYGDLRDILAGVDAVEKKYSIDDNRLGLTGWSYGGFMSMFAPTQTDRFHAVVAGAGLSNWQSYYGQNMIDQWMLPFFGASVYDDPAVYAKSSAVNFIKHDKSPTLIIAGEYDKECPAAQSLEFWHALRAMGTPTQLVIYPGEGHGFHKPEDSHDVMVRGLNWFQKYLAATPAR